MGAAWGLRDADPRAVEALASALAVDPLLARCLVVRGLIEPDAARGFLAPGVEALYDPYAMVGMDVAVARLRRAASAGEHVRIVTDYDVDGTTSSLILQGCLRLLGHSHVSYSIPHRMDEGYGFSERAAAEAADDGVALIVTADIGVKDHAAVSVARRRGVDVLVLDHHLPPGEDVPGDALAVLCPPQRRCKYPNKSLAACGVSFKVAQALLADHPQRRRALQSLIKLAAIGTVADVVDLMQPENRAIVSLGLRALNTQTHRPGLTALLQVAGTQPGTITAADLGYRIGPRINAAGRIASATAVVELLTASDNDAAFRQARELDAMNQERRSIQERMLTLALEQVEDPPPPFVVVWGDETTGWHRGVAGIVAARLRDRLNRPAAVIARTPKGATGSIRSIPQVHALRALEEATDLLERFGGHPAAAGFSLDATHLEALSERLCRAASAMLNGKMPELLTMADASVRAEQLDYGLWQSLQGLEPHGKGNAAPLLHVRDVRLGPVRVLKDRHAKSTLLLEGGRSIDVLWWGGAAHAPAMAAGREVELLGTLETNAFNGTQGLQLVLEDARFAE